MSEVVGAALAAAAEPLGDHATAVLARLGGALGDATRAAHADLVALDEAARKRRRAETAALARAAVPPGFRFIHASWIESALAGSPARARTAIAGESAQPIDIWLARSATASLPAMPVIPRTDLEQRIAREPAQVAAWLVSIALDQLAFALGPAVAAQPALATAATRIAQPPRSNALGPQRAALARCRDVALDDHSALLALAGRALAPHLAQLPLARLQLTRRLPQALGLVVERELLAAAAVGVDQVPSWAALLAD